MKSFSKLAPLALAFSMAAAAPSFAQTVDVADVVETVMPAVINITSLIPAGAIGEDGQPTEEDGKAFGSGFIFDGHKGYIVTNNHVVQGANDLTVLMADGQKLKATVIGADKIADLAVIQVPVADPVNHPLPEDHFGNSDAMRLGNVVVAIGSPFDLVGTITTGIISARNRTLGGSPVENYLQTDASINPGNSGGPLFNMQGEVIGINTAIYSKVGQSAGIGFSIPSNDVKWTAEQIIAHKGSVPWGFLGVQMTEVDADAAKAAGLDSAKGLLVQGVVKDSPAEKAGLKEGDILLSLNGQPITKMQEFRRSVAKMLEGGQPSVSFLREGQMHDVVVTLGALPKSEDNKAPSSVTPPPETKKGNPGVIIPNLPGLK